MGIKILLLLRKTTMKIRLFPGAIVLLNIIRCCYLSKTIELQVDDFDGDLFMGLCLCEHMQSQIFWYGYYNRDIVMVLRKFLKSGMVVIDVGANVGEISLIAAKLVGRSGCVYAFEPQLTVADKLECNIRLNGFSQVTIQKIGLSDKREVREIYCASSKFKDGSKNEGLATLYPSEERETVVGIIELVTLDDFCQSHEISKLDLIKIDIEGSELPVLRGAMGVLRKYMPYIIIEVQQETASKAGYNASDILSLLHDIGYRFELIERRGKLCNVNENSLGEFQNVLCSPRFV
jgi:FkbM family methyltransferase